MAALSSTPTAAPSTSKFACKQLVLDAGPLLSLSPLRGLAETFYTVPQVLDELKDKRAREHFERLALSAGVRIEIKAPLSTSVAHVIQWAKKTGDYSVLSTPDLCVLALTYELDEKAKASAPVPETKPEVTPSEELVPAPESSPVPVEAQPDDNVESAPEDSAESEAEEPPPTPTENGDSQDAISEDLEEREPLNVELQPIQDNDPTTPVSTRPHQPEAPPVESPADEADDAEAEPIYDDPSDEDDGEGEWITPSNVGLHKSHALDLLPSGGKGAKGKAKAQETIPVGCMTADFAMQNVLLQMGLGLVGVEGKRIERVKSWVLRCHACFKICKDNSRKFCPSCGNPTLLRASVTISSPNAGSNTPALQVHLKRNFQFKTRGTIYSIPAPKAGSAKTGPGEGLILREDQLGWQRAKKQADGKREREEKRMLNAASKSAEAGQGGTVVSSWMDPDWVPEMLSVGAGGKGRSIRARGFDGDMPIIGHGRKNPNEGRRKK
ncbi:Nin one binding Zn-ribbon like-domain-containing protein [Epithele typhae]|uniref:Nin one binding Zn-ribbon like-domain-containing protein n=1 Tax=Epithele typhae TaxID=378194 RepID=UPI0020073125|nr:Nin one binding Zn-ribbon like-domain-containing protein [Epithele typhae]KAH9943258.1 Nin one binding Zn-ribbon like-domain-containing protein [Epithele typhae]